MQAHSLSSRAASFGLVHDAGNLLNALGLYCDLLEKPEVLRAEHRHYAVELRGIARRSAQLLGRLAEPEIEPTAEGGLRQIASLEPVLAKLCGPESALSLSIGDSLPAVDVDVELVERIIVNLVRNAAEAIGRDRDSGGQIRVSLHGEGAALVLVVEDNGPGIAVWTALKFLQPVLLQPVSEAEPSVVPGARGLGHKIVRELALESGAAFEMRVRPGKGSSFTFRWNSAVNEGAQPA